jgi:hypothetical protein
MTTIKFLDILANGLNLIGFVILLSGQPYRDLIAYLRKEIDEFGHTPGYAKYSKREIWENKFSVPVGLTLVLVGNLMLLVLSIAQ